MTPEELFRTHPLFGALEPAERRDLVGHLGVRPAKSGDVIFREGEKADGLYGVLEGRIIVTVGSASGKELTLNSFGPGSFFGEIAFFDGEGRTATAMAREPSRLIFLGRAAFLPFLRRRPDAALRTIAFLCQQLRRTTQLVQDTTFLDVPTRLAKQMTTIAREYGVPGAGGAVTIMVSQQELAQMLGVSREIVSRQLALWRQAGIVEITRGRLTLPDVSAVERIGAGT